MSNKPSLGDKIAALSPKECKRFVKKTVLKAFAAPTEEP